MQVSFDELNVLQEIQRIDLEIIQTKKARASLPKRIEVAKIRKKRDEISPKLDQVMDMQAAKQAEITAVEDEDRSLVEKQDRAQADIDAAGADYRAVESHSKDMAGIVKRRVTLEEKLGELNGEMEKIQAVRNQLEAALALCEKKESELRSSYEAEDGELVNNIRKLMAQREELAKGISADLVKLYETTAAKTGGVARGRLEEDKCGVCRASIEGGRLIELRANAPLGSCPSCKRLLIVE